MKNSIPTSWLLAACFAGLLGAPNAAPASIEVFATRLADPAPGLNSYVLTATSDGDPITAFENLQVIGPVHQVNRFGTQPSIFLDQLISDLRPYDTHLLLNASQVQSAGNPIVETNDGSNPFGLTYESYAFGLGILGQPEGLTVIYPPYQSNSLDFLQVVFPEDSYVEVVGSISADDLFWFYLPLPPLPPSGQVVVDPDPVVFGPTRVGTTAYSDTYAWINSDEIIEWVAGSYITSGSPFGPIELNDCLLSTEYSTSIPFTFSPMSRGEFNAEGYVYADEGIDLALVTLSGTGVGPVLGAEQFPGTTIEFGVFPVDSFFDVFFEVANVTNDPELGELTSLNITAYIDGEDADAFDIIGDDAFSLSVGETDELHLRFDTTGLAPGEYKAVLGMRTDVGAAANVYGMGYWFWVRGLVSVPGDANGDGTVNADDAEKLAANWLQQVYGGFADGDFNSDCVVNDLDAAILAANWGYNANTPENAVPEPSILALLLGGVVGIFFIRARRRG